jgi:hypothetical protein
MIRCGHCREYKLFFEFYKRKDWCKECRKGNERLRRQNPELRARAHLRAKTDLHYRAERIYRRILKRARYEGYEFDLTPDWVLERLVVGTCEVTGLPFDFTIGRHNPYGPNVDRIQAGGAYSQANCRLVLCAVNQALMNWGLGTFEPIARAIAARASSE